MAVLHCPACTNDVPELSFESECPKCGSLLDLSFSVKADTTLADAFSDRRRLSTGWESSGVWRYRELILPTLGAETSVSFPEGNTPLIRSEPVEAFAGIHSLYVKHEGMNPTGSF